MKNSTKVLIIIGVVSLILGVILSIVSLVLIKNAGWRTIKDALDDNSITWEVSDWREDYDEDSEDVYVKGPFFEVDIQGEDAYVSIFGINIEVQDGHGRAYSDNNEETLPTETNATYESE